MDDWPRFTFSANLDRAPELDFCLAVIKDPGD